MSAHTQSLEQVLPLDRPMARWRRWLFNRLARWEEASVAKALGLPVDRVIIVDLSENGQS